MALATTIARFRIPDIEIDRWPKARKGKNMNVLLVGLSTMVAYLIAMVAWMRRHARLAQVAANEIDTTAESAVR